MYLKRKVYVSTLRCMQITSTLSRPQELIIDFSTVVSSANTSLPIEEMSNILQWVRSYPNRSNVHVYLPTSMRSLGVRKLQTQLQTLGCTVTMKTSFAIR